MLPSSRAKNLRIILAEDTIPYEKYSTERDAYRKLRKSLRETRRVNVGEVVYFTFTELLAWSAYESAIL